MNVFIQNNNGENPVRIFAIIYKLLMKIIQQLFRQLMPQVLQ